MGWLGAAPTQNKTLCDALFWVSPPGRKFMSSRGPYVCDDQGQWYYVPWPTGRWTETFEVGGLVAYEDYDWAALDARHYLTYGGSVFHRSYAETNNQSNFAIAGHRYAAGTVVRLYGGGRYFFNGEKWYQVGIVDARRLNPVSDAEFWHDEVRDVVSVPVGAS